MVKKAKRKKAEPTDAEIRDGLDATMDLATEALRIGLQVMDALIATDPGGAVVVMIEDEEIVVRRGFAYALTPMIPDPAPEPEPEW